MKQKLIMENWRKFLNESQEPTTLFERYERALEEVKNNPQTLTEGGLAASVFAMIMALSGGGESDINVNGMSISPDEGARAVQMLDNLDRNKYPETDQAIEEIGDMFATYAEDGTTNFKLNDASGSITRGEIGEPLALKALEKADTPAASADTAEPGDTGVETRHNLNVSVAINQMENAPNTEARNDWAQKILDYHEAMGENSNVPANVVDRAKFYLGK